MEQAQEQGSMMVSPVSLYVGDLEKSVTEKQLIEFFSAVGKVASVFVCCDVVSGQSRGYAYVNYTNAVDAARALETLNFTSINNKPIRIMHVNYDPSVRKNSANLFIKNLDMAVDSKALHDIFSQFGEVISCKISTDPMGRSKGYGYAQFQQEEAAKNAVEKLNGTLLKGKKVFVGQFLSKQERENIVDKTKFNNVFVKNLSESATEDDLKKIFGEYGSITSIVVMKARDGKSKCFGFVNFVNPDDAARAVQELNGKKFNEKEWYVGKAQKKCEREKELKKIFEQKKRELVEKNQGLNLFLKNLDDSVEDSKLSRLFSQFGTITSCKVMRDANGMSKGSAFVAFSTPEEASRALAEMNHKMVGSKPLYVALAQRKEDRKAMLQAQFSQMCTAAKPRPLSPHLPLHPHAVHKLGQRLLCGQPPKGLTPHQLGYGYRQQSVPAMRPRLPPMPHFFMPFMQQGQNGHRPLQIQQPMPLIRNQQFFPMGGNVYPYYPPRRNGFDGSMPGVAGGMVPIPQNIPGLLMCDGGISRPVPAATLTSTLANANHDQQKTILGDRLYPLVEQLEHEQASKVRTSFQSGRNAPGDGSEWSAASAGISRGFES